GSVRHWPRVPEAQLAQIMAKGPLSSSSKETRVAAARIPANPLAKLFGGAQDEDAETVATTAAATSARTAAQKSTPAPKNEKTAERTVTVAAVAPVPTPTARPAVRPAPATAQPAAQPVTQPAGFEMASATSRPVQLRPAQTASLVNRSGNSANDVIS